MSASSTGHGASSPRKTSEPKCFDSRSASLNPTVDYPPIGHPQRDAYLYDLAVVGAAPFMQCMPRHRMHAEYAEHARRNRERLAAAREAERAERARMIAAA